MTNAIQFFGVFVRTDTSKSYGRYLGCSDLAIVPALSPADGFERLSWGQHIFGFATPASISALNAQHENDFHNIRGIYFQSTTLGILLLFVFFVVAPLLATHERLARLVETIKMPLVPLQIADSHSLTRGLKHFACSTASFHHRSP